MTQPSLFDPPAAPILTFVVRCPACGISLAAVPVEGDVNAWSAAIQWGYLAQQGHNISDYHGDL